MYEWGRQILKKIAKTKEAASADVNTNRFLASHLEGQSVRALRTPRSLHLAFLRLYHLSEKCLGHLPSKPSPRYTMCLGYASVRKDLRLLPPFPPITSFADLLLAARTCGLGTGQKALGSEG